MNYRWGKEMSCEVDRGTSRHQSLLRPCRKVMDVAHGNSQVRAAGEVQGSDL